METLNKAKIISESYSEASPFVLGGIDTGIWGHFYYSIIHFPPFKEGITPDCVLFFIWEDTEKWHCRSHGN